MSDQGMMGDTGFEKRLRDNIQRIDERIESERELTNEKFAHTKSVIEGNDKRYDQRFQAQETATTYMRQVTNEFRGQLADQQATFITRSEALARAQANADKIDGLATRIDRTEGRSGGLNAGWVYLVAGIGALATIISIVTAIIVLFRR